MTGDGLMIPVNGVVMDRDTVTASLSKAQYSSAGSRGLAEDVARSRSELVGNDPPAAIAETLPLAAARVQGSVASLGSLRL